MIGKAKSMAGYMGGPTARIRMKGSGYENKGLHKPMKPKFDLKKQMSPPNMRALNTHTMNHVVNHRLGMGKKKIAQDTWLSKLI